VCNLSKRNIKGEVVSQSDETKIIQENLSLAALHMIVSAAGGSALYASHSSDALGLDVAYEFQGTFSQNKLALKDVEIAFQLKSTRKRLNTVNYNGTECWAYPLPVTQLRRYVVRRLAPLILVLLILPTGNEPEKWVEVSLDEITLKGVLYWTPFAGFPLVDQKYNTVYVPKKNVLTPGSTFNIVKRIAENPDIRERDKVLRYGIVE